MKIFVSQDELKAIATDKIDFFVINGERNGRGKYSLLAKTPVDSNNFYEYLVMFEHEDIALVKTVLANLLVFLNDSPDDFILHIDLPDLQHFFNADKLRGKFYQAYDSAE